MTENKEVIKQIKEAAKELNKKEKDSKLNKYLKKKLSWKDITKKQPRATVNLPVARQNMLSPMERDRSRFFREEWEDAKKQVFFSP